MAPGMNLNSREQNFYLWGGSLGSVPPDTFTVDPVIEEPRVPKSKELIASWFYLKCPMEKILVIDNEIFIY